MLSGQLSAVSGLPIPTKRHVPVCASLLATEALAERNKDHIAAKNAVLRHLYSAEPLDAEAVAVEYLAYAAAGWLRT